MLTDNAERIGLSYLLGGYCGLPLEQKMKCRKCGDRIHMESGQHWVHTGTGSMYCETLAEPGNTQDYHSLITDIYMAMICTPVVYRGDALRWRSLCDRMLDVIGEDPLESASK